MHLSDFEKSIYNEYLRAQRKGKPFTPRKQFDDLKEQHVVALKQLASFFTSLSNVKPRDFFNAGFVDSDFQTLEFFKTMKAIKLYNLYIADQLNKVDEDWTIDFVKSSMLFIYSFCKNNNIALKDYLNANAPAGFPWFIVHLKDLKICIFALLAFQGFETKLLQCSTDAQQILGDDFLREMPKHRTNFFASKKCKNIARQGLELINKQNKTNN